MKEYRVGQILYLIGEKSTTIMPIQVIEEVIRTTIDGTEKTYTIQLPDKKKTTADIKDIKGQIFVSIDNLRKNMLKNAENAIDRMIDKTIQLSKNNFKVKTSPKPVNDKLPKASKIQKMQQNLDDGIIRVDLGDGKLANVNVDNLEKMNAK